MDGSMSSMSITSPLLPANSSQAPPQLDDILTQYHPSCKRPPTTEWFSEYGTKVPAPPECPPDPEPWKPYFPKLRDFLFAEIILESGLSEPRCDDLIKLFHACIEEKGSFTIKNVVELKSMWNRASSSLTPVSRQ